MRRILVITLLLGAAVSLAGCTTVDPAASDHSVPAPALGDDGARQADGSSGSGGSGSGGSGEGAEAERVQGDREVISTGYLTVTADAPVDAAADAVRIVEAIGGRVDARSETAPADGDRGSAALTLRIPTARLSSTIDDLKALGDQPEVSISSVDVTVQVHDLDARIGALRASVDRLTALLTTAADTDVLIKLESAISDRQGTLESMEAQQRSLADQVSMSTLDLNIISPADAPVRTPDTFWSGLETGWAAFVGALGFLLVAAGVLLPWLAVGVVVAGFVWLVLRRRSQRSTRARAQDVPTA
jgi:predicted small secreted protein